MKPIWIIFIVLIIVVLVLAGLNYARAEGCGCVKGKCGCPPELRPKADETQFTVTDPTTGDEMIVSDYGEDHTTETGQEELRERIERVMGDSPELVEVRAYGPGGQDMGGFTYNPTTGGFSGDGLRGGNDIEEETCSDKCSKCKTDKECNSEGAGGEGELCGWNYNTNTCGNALEIAPGPAGPPGRPIAEPTIIIGG